MVDDRTANPMSGPDPPVERDAGVAQAGNDVLGRAAGQLAENGVSATLAGVFSGLADQSTSEGRPRFRGETVTALRRAVLCRTWAPLTLEIGHWFEVLARGSPDEAAIVLRAVYIEEVNSAQHFRYSVEHGRLVLPHGARLEGNKLHCGPAQEGFCLHLHRLQLWLALLELLIYIDPNLVTEVSPEMRAVDWARRLQKLFNSFLSEHLQPSRWQQRAYGALKWLAEQAPDSAPETVIDDQRILEFWRHANPDDDYRRFRSVAEVFLYLYRALIAGARARAAEHAMALDEMHEWLAVDPVHAEYLDEDRLDGGDLTRHPKFLTARVWQECELSVTHQDVIDQLPLTLLRMQVFGNHQARLIEAGKRGRPFDWGSLETDTYCEWLERLVAHRATIDQAALAGIEVLLQLEEMPEALGLLVDWHPEAFSDSSGEAGQLPFSDTTTTRELNTMRLQMPALNHALEACRKAFKAINRAGFRSEDDFAQPSAYRAGVAKLLTIDGVLAHFLHRIDSAKPNYAADLAIFRDRFQTLHGKDA
ncbi:hypothetical protein [Wenzhouxiangella sp. EGI_FJ10305]|uniref:hypothetical protein n=1 Tax=Wenzhouxiangella sp. EGI_FJ10305 TaxID=3243768 RepID=UPI0035E2E767